MPLVRIDYPQSFDDADVSALSLGVHRAMLDTFNVPTDDFFQVLTGHVARRGLRGPDAFLGIQHTAELVFIQITCAEGRSTEMKRALYKAIVDNCARVAKLRPDDIVINLVETKRENWSFGLGGMPFAPPA